MTQDNNEYWSYRARLERVVDGDTVDLEVDLGFRTHKTIRVRLPNVDTAEIYGSEKDSEEYKKGIEQTKFVEDFLNVDGEWPLRFESMEESGKYGRWIGDISIDGEYLTEALISEWPEVSN